MRPRDHSKVAAAMLKLHIHCRRHERWQRAPAAQTALSLLFDFSGAGQPLITHIEKRAFRFFRASKQLEAIRCGRLGKTLLRGGDRVGLVSPGSVWK